MRISVLTVIGAALVFVGLGIVASLASVVSLASGGSRGVQWTYSDATSVDRSFDLGEASTVRIVAGSSDVRIVPSAGMGNTLRVAGRTSADVAKHIDLSRSGSLATLTLSAPGMARSWSFAMFDDVKPLVITLDEGRRVAIVTTSGDVTVTRSRAPYTIETTSGDAVAQDAESDLVVHTTSGDVRSTGVRGSLAVRTSSGDVVATLDDVRANDSIETSSGDVDLHVAPSVRAALVTSTSSGDVENEAALPSSLAGAPTIAVTTSSGDIKIRRAANGAP